MKEMITAKAVRLAMAKKMFFWQADKCFACLNLKSPLKATFLLLRLVGFFID